ncbi:Ig-like domain-containing protein, partial [Aliivibrio salmonicida]|uniref:Ig-like domain-containing protein n=1 Tax=Aliivibrio salmonicida TaxID=40269 RepID=UPI003D0B22D9
MHYLNYALLFLASLTLTACNNGDEDMLGGPELDQVIIDLRVTPETASIPAGLGVQYQAIATLSSSREIVDFTTEHGVSWSSEDTHIATVNSSTGYATGITPGITNITALVKVNGVYLSESAVLEVTNAIVDGEVVISSDAEDDRIASGLPVSLIATTTFTDGTVFESDNLTGQTLGIWSLQETYDGVSINAETGIMTTGGNAENSYTGAVGVILTSSAAPAWPNGETAEITINITDATVNSEVVISSDAPGDKIASGLPVSLIATTTFTDGTVFESDNLTGQTLGIWSLQETYDGVSINAETGIMTTGGNAENSYTGAVGVILTD